MSEPAFAEPNLAGFWAPAMSQPDPETELTAKLPPNTVIIRDSGAPEFPRMEFGGLKLTPDAHKHAEEWKLRTR